MVTTATTTVVTPTPEQQRLDALSGQMSNLQRQTATTQPVRLKNRGSNDRRTDRGCTSPVPLVEPHVGLAETNIAAIQKNLSDNLGISVHALVDAGYGITSISPTATRTRIAIGTRMDSSSRKATCTSSATERLDS